MYISLNYPDRFLLFIFELNRIYHDRVSIPSYSVSFFSNYETVNEAIDV